MVVQRIGPGMIQQMQTQCTDCGGRGEIINDKDRCKDCKGKKVQPEAKILEVVVSPGMPPGHKITFYNDADEEPNKETGDVIVVLTPAKEDEEKEADSDSVPSAANGAKKAKIDVKRPKFQRLKNGVDLVIEHKISLIEALIGFKIALKHLDDRIFVVESPANHVVQHEQIVVVEGEGMPREKNPTLHGDLYLKLNIVMPTGEYIQSLGTGKIKMLLQLLPPALHSVNPDLSVYAHRDEESGEEIPPQIHSAKPYDADEHQEKQRQRAEENRRGESYEEEEEGAGGAGGQPGCRQM